MLKFHKIIKEKFLKKVNDVISISEIEMLKITLKLVF